MFSTVRQAMILFSVLLSFAPPASRAINNGLARTPQMGWNNWNSLGCDVSESLLLDNAQGLVSSGLRDLGYKYVVLDDCWSDGRDDEGYVRPDLLRFPHGMKHVADEIHRMNMLYGMYSSAGELTCARYEGSLDWEMNDAEIWASWGVDYLKYDNCYNKGRFGVPTASYARYEVMARALNATRRPILYSLCNWGEDYVHAWGPSISNSWRVTGDIYDSFTRPDAMCSCVDPASPHCLVPGAHCSVLYIINKIAPYSDRGGPGGWNDLDMLEVGNGGMTDEEYKAHFAFWAALKSPLLIGADLRKLDAKTLTILNNPAVIALNQDPLGRAIKRVSRDENVKKDKWGVGETQIWSGSLYRGDQAVLFLNAADEDLDMSAALEEIFVFDGPGGTAPQSKLSWDVYDLWANRMDEGTAERILGNSDRDPGFAFEMADWYNASEKSYREGLDSADKRLLGKKIGNVKPGSSLTARVPRHAAKIFRLRSPSGGSKRYSMYKDEL